MKILICGDICPTKSNENYFEIGDSLALIGKELFNILKKADYRIANLECPLTEHWNPIVKAGPNLIASRKSVNGIKAMGIDFLTLANNHILDHDVEGLDSTIEILEREDISYAGIGKNLEEAAKPYVIEQDGVRVGIYCCAEHEFTIAKEDKAGANPFDPLYSLDHISDLKKSCDYVIVLYHGLKEYYRYPTPKLQRTLRRVVEKGADLVICQHSHCIGCEEDYKGGKIIYGQGNFIFDDGDNEFWNTGMIVDVTVGNLGGVVNRPIFFVKENHAIHIADKETGNKLMNDYVERSGRATDYEYITKNYKKFVGEMLPGYLRAISGPYGNNIFVRGINFICMRKFYRYMFRHYKKQHLLAIRNYIESECHHELMLQGLNILLEDEGEGKI